MENPPEPRAGQFTDSCSQRINQYTCGCNPLFRWNQVGVSGLINAYKTAAKEALESAIIIEKQIEETYRIFLTIQ